MGKYHPTFFGIELAIPPEALSAEGGIAAQSLRMLDGIFPYLPQKNHGNLSIVPFYRDGRGGPPKSFKKHPPGFCGEDESRDLILTNSPKKPPK